MKFNLCDPLIINRIKWLSNYPEVQKKLREELLSNLEDPCNRFLKYEDVMSEKTPYLDAVIAEIQRCSGVAGGTTRQGE